MTSYSLFIDRLRSLPFVENDYVADAVTKATLGVVVSSLPEDFAWELTGQLPYPLTLEKLRGHQIKILRIPLPIYIREIMQQFHFTHGEALQAIEIVLMTAIETIDRDTFLRIQSFLPHDWTYFLGRLPRHASHLPWRSLRRHVREPSDKWIYESVCERLMHQRMFDPSHIEVEVKNGEVTLLGSVSRRFEKFWAEDLIAHTPGIKNIHNHLQTYPGKVPKMTRPQLQLVPGQRERRTTDRQK